MKDTIKFDPKQLVTHIAEGNLSDKVTVEMLYLVAKIKPTEDDVRMVREKTSVFVISSISEENSAGQKGGTRAVRRC